MNGPGPADGPDRLRAADYVLAGASLVLVVVAFVWPPAAPSLVRILVLVVATWVVGRRLLAAGLPPATLERSYSPFQSQRRPVRQDEDPHTVQELARTLRSADDPAVARRAEMPWGVRRRLRREARYRLLEGHGLDPDDPDHRQRILALAGPDVARLVLSREGAEEPDGRLTLHRLEPLLQTLERL